MKTLTKIIGVTLFGLVSSNLNAQDISFVKEDYDKYCLKYNSADVNDDSIPDVIVVDYDLNSNGKRDFRGVFIITGKKEIPEKGVVYYTKSKACMLMLDRNEDGVDDEIFIDVNLDGVLENYRKIKKTSVTSL